MARKPKAGAGEPARPEPEGKAPETAEERAFRMALARELMATPDEKLAEARVLFERLCAMMGESKARAQWQAIAKRPRGRPPKMNQERAEALCRWFDGGADWIGRYDEKLGRKLERDTIIRIMAEILVSKKGGQSIEAKAQEIRRALRARDAEKGMIFGMKPKRQRGRPKASGEAPVMTKISD